MKKQHADEDVTFSDLLGSTLAIVQHGIDLAVTGLFKRLKQSADAPAKKNEKSGWMRAAADFTRGFVGFIGKTGDSYMETYTELKQEKKE
jgi:hypothetical protein